MTSITIVADKLGIRGGRASRGFTLEDVPQGSVAVRLSLGTGLTRCADAPAKPVGTPLATVKTDDTSKLLAQRGMPPPATCPPLP